MNVFKYIKNFLSIKLYAIMGYIMFSYNIFLIFFYNTVTEDELVDKEISILFFALKFYLLCFIIFILFIIEFSIKKNFLKNKYKKSIFDLSVYTGLILHLSPIISYIVYILIYYIKKIL